MSARPVSKNKQTRNMKQGNNLVLFIFLCNIVLVFCTSNEDLFLDFIRKYDKQYIPGTVEYGRRLIIFEQSLERHKQLNSLSNHSQDAFYGVTIFSDLTKEEFTAHVLGHVSDPIEQKYNSFDSSLLVSLPGWKRPKLYDLRKLKPSVVTAVTDQGSCGGCWAFSIVETIETQYSLKHPGVLYTLSSQQLIDCSVNEGNEGCSGGNICTTVKWLNNSQTKITTEKAYPFVGKTDKCSAAKLAAGKISITNFTCSIERFIGHEEDMLALVANHGALSVAVDATSWQDYLGGIIQHHCSNQINHAVQIIGYDTSGPVPHYIVRNSWGKRWGLDGYIHIKIGGNLCGIAHTVATVFV